MKMCTWWGPVLLSWCDPLAHNPRLSFHPVYHYRTPQILQIPTLDLIFMLISVLNSADLILLPKDIKKTLNLVLFWRGLQWSQKRTALVFLCRTQINKWWEFLKKKKQIGCPFQRRQLWSCASSQLWPQALVIDSSLW